ncbi:MAG: carboxypeptidase-like regulatory domain-containing protein [Defluviitaleaceae bacterium]|nr:carboxypeptidase-like regulatory domain-containing protein [Defluviitaleaceae bacterium]
MKSMIKEVLMFMGMGFLQFEIRTAFDALPIPGASVTVSFPDGGVIHTGITDENGQSEVFELAAPDKQFSLDPNYEGRPYSVYDAVIEAPGFVTRRISGFHVLDGRTTLLIENLRPIESGRRAETSEYIEISEHALLEGGAREQAVPPPLAPDVPRITMNEYDEEGAPNGGVAVRHLAIDDVARVVGGIGGGDGTIGSGVRIPEFVTVHLGHFSNLNAPNVRVRFADYIANVTTHEIFATWPRNSILANIHAIVTFTLNRLFVPKLLCLPNWSRCIAVSWCQTNTPTNPKFCK